VSEKASGTDEELRARLERTFEAPDGAFTVRGLVPGRFRVLVRADGYRPAVRGGIDVAKGKITPGVVVSLEAESGARAKPASISKAGVRGSVVDASTGSPIAGAVVQVTVARSLEGSARTEGDGTFFVPVAKAGKARAIATHEEYLDAESAAFSAESGASAVAPTIALRPGGAVEGVAVGADGEPMPGGFVQAELAEGERDDADRPRGKTAQADASGRFRIAGLESGTWTVVMREGVDVRAAAAAVVVEGSTTKVVLRKPPPGRDLRGRVTRAGEPVAHAEVHADSPDAPVFTRRHLSTWTAGDGMFAIERVPDGSGFVRVAAGGVTWRRPIEVGGERDLYLGIELPSGTVGGTVWTSDGSEASGVRVLVRPATAGAASSRTWAEATTDASGRYAISGLAAGHYRVIAGAAGSAIAYAAQAKTTDVADGRPAQADFTLDAGERVVVEVVDARGEPLRKATVKLVPERSGDADEEALPSATTDVDGRARILNAGVGTWVARAFVKGKAVGESARFRVDRGREPRVRIDVK
ncbi:MAG TPA: carboxypeptidase regulatory-like domain-containing protein, partial [Planctomycetota bacterium]|nr:carboxypeptidase regulatory-like domain-containing protein [Planctomycetota bacterium]